MPLSEDDARDVVKDLLKVRETELLELNKIYGYMTGETSKIYSPRRTTAEYQRIVNMSKVNILPLVVSAFAENLFVEGYRSSPKQAKNAPAWDLWQDQRMDQRQSLIYRSALTYGLSYCVVLKKQGGGALMEPYSPRQLTAVYDDPVNDEWPIYAIACCSGYDRETRKPVTRIELYDDQWRYCFKRDSSGQLTYVDSPTGDDDEPPSGAHGLPETPVVRFVNAGVDLDQGPVGEVAPLMTLQDQLDNTTYGLLIAQQFSAFRQRWVTGMTIEEDANGAARAPFNGGVDRIMQAESPDTKFGEFGETTLEGYLASRQSTLRIISARAQLAPHSLLVSDGVTNLSAEALAALEAAQQRKTGEQKTSFGESVEQMMRLASAANGDQAGWEDTSAQVMWRDTESRSLAQVADALGKMAQMLAIPPRVLWERVPGVTEQDLQRWNAEADKADGLAEQAMQEASAATAANNAAMPMMQGAMNGVVPAGATRATGPARASIPSNPAPA